MVKEKALVVDIDGTAADIRHRLHLIDMSPGREDRPVKDWDAFFSKMSEDTLIVWCAEIIKRFKPDHKIIFCTGRSKPYFNPTVTWLETNIPELGEVGMDYLLYMRPHDDNRQDDIVKKEIYELHIKPFYDVLFVLDDRLRLAKMWRSLGLVCLHCDDGEF